MSPPPISTGFHSLGSMLSASVLGSPTGRPDYPKCATGCQAIWSGGTTIVMAGSAPAACAAPIPKDEAAAANNGAKSKSRRARTSLPIDFSSSG
jgi:hypothetical protein